MKDLKVTVALRRHLVHKVLHSTTNRMSLAQLVNKLAQCWAYSGLPNARFILAGQAHSGSLGTRLVQRLVCSCKE